MDSWCTERGFLCRVSMLKPLEENTYRCLISFRSSDFGTLYTKLNLQPGIATVIDNFYICSTNKKKVCGKKNNFCSAGEILQLCEVCFTGSQNIGNWFSQWWRSPLVHCDIQKWDIYCSWIVQTEKKIPWWIQKPYEVIGSYDSCKSSLHSVFHANEKGNSVGFHTSQWILGLTGNSNKSLKLFMLKAQSSLHVP